MAAPLDAPTNLTAVASAYNTVVLTWDSNESASTRIQWKESGGTYSVGAVVASGVETYTHSTASRNTQYTYRVRHFLGDEYSDWHESDAVWTPPQPPSDLAVAYSGRAATLTWTVNGTYTYLKVYYKASSASAWTTDTETLSGTATTRAITVPAEVTNYDFRIRGYYSSSTLNSDYETESTQTSGLAAPTNFEAASASSGTQIDLTWTDNSSAEGGFEVYVDGAAYSTPAANATSASVTSRTPGETYTVKIRAYTGTTYSEWTDEETVVMSDPPDADAVIGTVTAVSSTSLTVTWTDTATNATRFYLYRSTDDSTYEEVTYTASGIQTYTDTGLTDDTKYYYKVRAWNTSGYSALSSSANGTTSLDLDPPTDLVASAISSTQIKLTWTDNATSADYHSVERKVSGGSYAEVGTVATGTSEYTSGSLTAGTEYTFRLRARHDTPTTYGDYSAPVTKTITAVGTDSVRRNETYIGLSNIVGIASDEPKSTITCSWRSKPMDFSDQDSTCLNKLKTVRRVQLEFIDEYSSIPVTVYLSVDDGEHWNSCSRYIGEGESKSKTADFYLEPLTGQFFTVKVTSTSAITKFTWTGLNIKYNLGGEYIENDLSTVSDDDTWVVYERGTVDGGTPTSAYLDEDTYSGGDV